MSWWGKTNDTKTSTTVEEQPTSFESPYAQYDDSSSQQYAAPSSSFGSSGLGNFEKELRAEQEKILIQTVLQKLTDVSFEQCVPKPSTSLSSSEKACIHSVVSKYLDTSELVVGTISQIQQQGR
jgi:import inner membrane translocase subunit TIM13